MARNFASARPIGQYVSAVHPLSGWVLRKEIAAGRMIL
jgi:hypothetical protein